MTVPSAQHSAIAERIIGNIAEATSPAISPDGSLVAFVVSSMSMTTNSYRKQVWLAATDGSSVPRPVTSGDKDTSPSFSADGRTLLFTSARGKKKGETTLHAMPVDAAGEVRTLATMPDGISSPTCSPDGQWIAFTSRTQHERYRAEDESWQSPRKIETFFTRLNGENWVFDRPEHVYVVRADGTGEPRNLTPGPHQFSDITWLRDSTGVVTSGAIHDTWDRDYANDLVLVTLAGEVRALTGQTGHYHSPSVSPDGRHIAFVGHDDSEVYPQNMRVGVLPIGGGEHRWLTAGLDRTFDPTAGSVAPIWIDDETLLSSAEDRGQCRLHRIATADHATALPTPITAADITVEATAASSGITAFVANTVTELNDVFVLDELDPASGPRRLTTFAATYAAVANPQGWERFAVPCTDGSDEIDAWIMRPAGFVEGRSYPVVLNVHGGPHTQYGETFFDEAQFQAAAGFVVLMSNPRGSSGRHTHWGQSISGPDHPKTPGTGWGSVDVDDVMAVLDHALATYPFCDAQRVGMQGGSYGGYMATMLAGRFSNRFQAICSERAVNNLLTEEYSADIATMFRIEHGADHISTPSAYTDRSPSALAADIDVPFLIIHSEEDYRCPIIQAEELFVALRLLNKDVTFYRFPGESHELSRSGSPIHRRQRAEILLDFFAQHLKPAQG